MALFVAPALLDAAFDTSPRDLRRNAIPIASLAVVAVVLTTVAVAFLGWRFAGLPIAAAIALGVPPADPHSSRSGSAMSTPGYGVGVGPDLAQALQRHLLQVLVMRAACAHAGYDRVPMIGERQRDRVCGPVRELLRP